MVRVGIIFDVGENWLGGVNYYRNLINAVYRFDDRKIEIVIFTGMAPQPSLLQDMPNLELIKSSMLDFGTPLWRLRRLCIRSITHDLPLMYLLRKNHIDVLSHSGWLGKQAKIPTFGWIPDFQHLHFPEFFSDVELRQRDETFGNVCRFCNKVIVSSQNALEDLKRFSPDNLDKAVVLNFSAAPIEDISLLPALTDLQDRYGFHESFFLLPNQFWVHKNHQVVIDALAILAEKGQAPLILSTGNTHDARQPDHYEYLSKLVQIKKLSDRFKILGMIPFMDLNALLFYAKGIINPSLFEGWSTTVEEGKALGKTLILSDIAVHREQAPKNAYYFEPYNSEALAKILISETLETPVMEWSLIKSAADKEYRRFAKTYQAAICNFEH